MIELNGCPNDLTRVLGVVMHLGSSGHGRGLFAYIGTRLVLRLSHFTKPIAHTGRLDLMGESCAPQQIIVVTDNDMADSPLLGIWGTIEVFIIIVTVFSRLNCTGISVINGNGQCITLRLVKLLTCLYQQME